MRLGIDLGTTRSAAGVVEATDPTLLKNERGDRLTPSIVYFDDDGDVVVGKAAKGNGPENEVSEIKREMGEDITVRAGGEEHTPPEVSSQIVEKLCSYSENYLDEPVDELVITVPAYFTADQKAHTQEAAELAGFDQDHVELLHEPTAAAVAYGYNEDVDETVMVFDFGGGTLDISVMDITGNQFDMLATSGDTDLGGSDFTEAIVDLLADEYEADEGVDPRSDQETLYNLRSTAEERKKDLSASEKTKVNEPLLGQIDGDIVGIQERVLTRSEFEQEIDHLLDRAEAAIEEALEKADLDRDEIDSVLLVGGTSQVPAVQDRVEDFFGVEPDTTNDLDRIVAQGAALVASGEDVEERYRCPQCSYTSDNILNYFEHIADQHGVEKCPFQGCNLETGSKDELKQHLADEHDSDVSGPSVPTKRDITDIVTRSLGTDINEGRMDIILEHGQELPAENTRAYTTLHEDQPEMPIHVFQGENEENRDENEQLHSWSIDLDELPEMDNDPIVEVTFRLDEDGVLEVTAFETNTETSMTTEVQTSGRRIGGSEKKEAAGD